MAFSLDRVAACSLPLVLISSLAQSPAPDPQPELTATVQVLVRDIRGQPVSGLGIEDFVIQEQQGSLDRIVRVQRLGASVPAEAGPDARTAQASPVTQNAQSADPWKRTSILVILPPMSKPGRHDSIASLQKFLSRPHPADWNLALLDDAGEFLPFSADPGPLRARLDHLEHHVSPQRTTDEVWRVKTDIAIAELAVQPGRRAIVFASDRVRPLSFIDSAVRAQAAMYTVKASGPGVAVPFGGAAEFQVVGTAGPPITTTSGLSVNESQGQSVANSMNSQFSSLGVQWMNYLQAADETGGRSALDIDRAFRQIEADGDGYYRITFRPQIDEPDGAWHALSVRVRRADAHVHGTRFYLVPVLATEE